VCPPETSNAIKGTDQTKDDFVKDILDRLAKLALPESEVDKTYHHRGKNAYVYLQDIVFKDVQKFNQALHIIDLSEPTGVTAQQQVNMAVSIHIGKTNRRNYNYKDFNPNEWRFYCVWVHIKVLHKFAYEHMGTGATKNGYTEIDDNPQDVDGNLDSDENVGSARPSSGSEGNADTSSTTSRVIKTEAAVQHLKLHGGGFGTKKTKAATCDFEESRQKMRRLEELTNGINELVRVNQQCLEMQRIKAALKEFKNNLDVCSELRQQLLSSCHADTTVPNVPPQSNAMELQPLTMKSTWKTMKARVL